jgi:hypothetical protein
MSVLAEVARAAGPALAGYARDEPGHPRFADAVEDGARLFVLEAVYEGYLMHYGVSRVFTGMDDDLCLLAGDALYALGLARLAQEGDLAAVAELSDLISLSAQAHAAGASELVPELWAASARALSRAGGPGVRQAAHGRLGRGQTCAPPPSCH